MKTDISWEQEWDKIYRNQGEVQHEILPTAEMSAKLFCVENVKTILDLGCGMGRHSIFFAQRGLDVTATDISEKGVETTKQKAHELGLKIKSICHDMRDIPFSDNEFDAVFCIWTSGHGSFSDMRKHAEEMLRVVKPDGLIVVDYVSKDDRLYGAGTEIEKDTFINNVPGEETIPHHYTDEQEIRKVYEGHQIKVTPYVYSLGEDSCGNIHNINANIVICKKVSPRSYA